MGSPATALSPTRGTIGGRRNEGVETAEHLVFRWSPSGYTLDVRAGEPPSPGGSVVEGERRYKVTKVAPSPLPGDRRWCAYLLPGSNNGPGPDDTQNDSAFETHGEPVAVWTEPRTDIDVLLEALPGGACVVAVDAEGRRLGLTVDSLVSLSLDPPLVGFVVGNDNPILELLGDAGGCAISILAGGQEWLADHFAEGARPIAMWHALAGEPGAVGAPLFVGALGWLECSLLDVVDLGSSTLSVLAIRRMEPGTQAPALVRVRGAYATV
jgi:flavin reductase (DIM6/NTAB) family NADH-FMN oxidoreductase RutF